MYLGNRACTVCSTKHSYKCVKTIDVFPNESATREIKEHVIEGNVASCPDAYTKACEEENEMGNIYHCKKRGCKEYPRNKKAGGKTDPPTSYEVIPFSHK